MLPEHSRPVDRQIEGEVKKTLNEIVSGLAWLISGLDHSLPYGFKGKAAFSFAKGLQSLKGNEIRRHMVEIADALDAVTAAVAEEYRPGRTDKIEVERDYRTIDEALHVLSPMEYPDVMEYNFITMGYAVEAIDRYTILLHDALERFSSELSGVLGDAEGSMPRIHELRASWQDSERHLTDILIRLRRALTESVERIRAIDSR